MTTDNATTPIKLAQAVAARYAALPPVVAVALGGSRSTAANDEASDIDLYVYLQAPLSLNERAQIVRPHASYAEVGNDTWEPGDEWVEQGIVVDAMFRTTDWIETQLARVLGDHQASVGYSTALWHNVRTSDTLYDRDGWFARLQHQAQQPYPEALRHAIIAKNHPILRQTQSSYKQQIAKALARDDLVSVNHRVAALLASYFDVLFAVNRLPHPGEKRLVALVERWCPARPAQVRENITALLRTSATGDNQLLVAIDTLLDELDELLRDERLL